jgi:hypothetical protein
MFDTLKLKIVIILVESYWPGFNSLFLKNFFIKMYEFSIVSKIAYLIISI